MKELLTYVAQNLVEHPEQVSVNQVEGDGETVQAQVLRNGSTTPVILSLPGLTREERDIILAGCLINYYAE